MAEKGYNFNLLLRCQKKVKNVSNVFLFHDFSEEKGCEKSQNNTKCSSVLSVIKFPISLIVSFSQLTNKNGANPLPPSQTSYIRLSRTSLNNRMGSGGTC